MHSRGTRRRPHSKIQAALKLLEHAKLEDACRAEPPPLLKQGIEEFNRRQFFEQHETLEELWRAEPRPIRYLYQGILQIGVGFFHVGRGNFHGALVKLENGLALLAAFEPACMGVDVARLRRETAACLDKVLELGPDSLEQLDATAIPRVQLV